MRVVKPKDMSGNLRVDSGTENLLTVNDDGELGFATRLDFQSNQPSYKYPTHFGIVGHPYDNYIRGKTQVNHKMHALDDVTVNGRLTVHDKLVVGKGFWARHKLHTDGYLQLGTGEGTKITEDDLKTIKSSVTNLNSADGDDGLCCFSEAAKGSQTSSGRNFCLPPGDWHTVHMGLRNVNWAKCGKSVSATMFQNAIQHSGTFTNLGAGEEMTERPHAINAIRVRSTHNPLASNPFT